MEEDGGGKLENGLRNWSYMDVRMDSYRRWMNNVLKCVKKSSFEDAAVNVKPVKSEHHAGKYPVYTFIMRT